MLNKIRFKNYKSFENGELVLKPITILLGANSSGKSSILQLLLMFGQTLNLESGYESALKLNGKNISLGEIENIFRNKSKEKLLTFSFGINPNRGSFQSTEILRLKKNLEIDIVDLFYKFRKIEQFTSNDKRAYRLSKQRSINEIVSSNDIVSIFKEIKRIKRLLSKRNHDQLELFEEDINNNRILRKRVSIATGEIKSLLAAEINEYQDAYKLLEEISKLKSQDFTIEFDIKFSKKTKTLYTSRLSIQKESVIVIEYELQNNSGQIKHSLHSDVFNNKILNKYRIKFGKNVEFDTLNLVSKTDSKFEPQRFRRGYVDNELFCTSILRIFNSFYASLSKDFHSSRINYISPLRAFPKRYYFLDESNVSSSLDSIDGDNLTEVLKKEKDVREKVNGWLNTFGLTVGVEDVEEVIHRLKVSQNGLNLDITDVGFGVSQVLPIIVQGFLSKENSLTIIEQPEIHLHPMMQAELADLFIDVVKPITENRVLLIETHSEAILKRLRRRIAEGNISPNDVAIYFVNGRKKKSASATVEKIEISETGAFDWPKEFYSTDFEDTTEFLKYQ